MLLVEHVGKRNMVLCPNVRYIIGFAEEKLRHYETGASCNAVSDTY
jgi:hypothetical protein